MHCNGPTIQSLHQARKWQFKVFIDVCESPHHFSFLHARTMTRLQAVLHYYSKLTLSQEVAIHIHRRRREPSSLFIRHFSFLHARTMTRLQALLHYLLTWGTHLYCTCTLTVHLTFLCSLLGIYPPFLSPPSRR